ncbi:MAG: hypothetical protein Q8R86_11105 [Sulfuricurvum sp.]|nr:hypothetical protein [Sulfuricurvum sp.]
MLYPSELKAQKSERYPVILENKSFRSFRGLQGTFVPATKTDEFVLVRNIS